MLPTQTRAYVETQDRMFAFELNTKAQAQTKYLYSVIVRGSFPHTAFRTEVALMRWLELRGLQLTPNWDVGTYRVVGSYRKASHSDYAEFWWQADQAIHTRTWSNSEVTLALITSDADGVRTVHTLNPNCEHRPTFDRGESRRMEDAGIVDAYPGIGGLTVSVAAAHGWGAEAGYFPENGPPIR